MVGGIYHAGEREEALMVAGERRERRQGVGGEERRGELLGG